MVQLLQNLADEFADFAQGMVRGNPLLRMNVRKHSALILRPSAHLQSSRRIRGELNHHSFALARFFSKLLAGFAWRIMSASPPKYFAAHSTCQRQANRALLDRVTS